MRRPISGPEKRIQATSTDAWEVSADLVEGTGPFSLNVSGAIEFERAGRTVTDYTLSAHRVSQDVSLDLRGEENGPKVVRVETGETGTVTGHFNLESHAESLDDDGAQQDTDDGGQDTPLHVYVNTDPSDGSYTGGSVDLVNLSMSTGYWRPPSAANRIALMKSTGQGVEDVGASVRLHGIQRLEAHVDPQDAGTAYDFQTEFESVGHERAFQLRQRNGSETTKVWSDTWPDEATVEAFDPEGVFARPSLFMEGGGGELEWTCTVRLEEEWCGPAWVLNVQIPIGKVADRQFHHDYTIVIPDGTGHETLMGAFQPAIGDMAKDVLTAYKDAAVETKDALLSTVDISVTSDPRNGETFASSIEIRRTDVGKCAFQFDLDGVTPWQNQSVAHGTCNGNFTVDHASDDYELRWEGGHVNASGQIQDVSVQYKNDTERRGDTTYRDATLDGSVDYADPSLTYREGDEEYELPACFWEKDC